MNLFRSEEHVERWLGGRPPGRTISVSELSGLGHDWYEDRLAPGWLPHAAMENQAILDRIGLTGEFWRLA